MKILACHNYYQQRGGEDQFFEDEIELLSMQGHSVIPYTVENDSISDMNLLKVARQSLWNSQSAATVKQLIARHQPDVMHVVNTFPLVSPSIFHAAREMNLPVVASIQNYRFFCAHSMCYRDGKACEACLGKIPWRAVWHGCYRGSRVGSAVVAGMQMLHRGLKTWTRYIDVICVASEFSKGKLIAAGFDEQQMMIKPNFVFDDPGKQTGQSGYALFVGRLAGEKGIHTVVDAWQQQGLEIPLKIVGDGPEFDGIQQVTRDNPHIELVGRRPNTEMSQWMGAAACLIFPSTGYESLPKTLIESLAVGTPVIGSAIGSIPEIVRDDETGYLYPAGDSAALAATVKTFFDNRSQWGAMRTRCRDAFEKHYTAEANHRALIHLYTQAIRKRHGNADALPTPDNTSLAKPPAPKYQSKASRIHG